jgi:uncharacterized protein (UPF0261 family)
MKFLLQVNFPSTQTQVQTLTACLQRILFHPDPIGGRNGELISQGNGLVGVVHIDTLVLGAT